MSPSKMRKTRAYQDGVLHADGGEDLRSSYGGDRLVAYDLGYREHIEYLERQHRVDSSKWIVMWINHQYEPTWEVFDTEDGARTFVEKERPNIQSLYRGELIEEFE